MSEIQYQQEFAAILLTISKTTKTYYWKVHGDNPNSLSQLLDIKGSDIEFFCWHAKYW